MACKREDRILEFGTCNRELGEGREALRKLERGIQLGSARERMLEQTENLVHGAKLRLRIARWAPQPDQKSDVTRDTVADFAKPAEVHKQPLFEKSGQGIVKICEFCKAPEIRGDLRTFGTKAKKIRENTKPLFDLGFQGGIVSVATQL